MTRFAGHRCDVCGVTVEDDGITEGLPVGWYRVQRKAHACADDYLDVGHFCSERCLVARLKKIKDPTPPLSDDGARAVDPTVKPLFATEVT